MPDGEDKGKKTKLTALISSIVVAAAPGVYSAYQTAKNERKQQAETKEAAKQERALQQWATSNKVEIGILKKTCVTHQDLYDVTRKLQHRFARRSRSADPTARERDLQAEVDRLKAKARAAKASVQKAEAPPLPKLRPRRAKSK